MIITQSHHEALLEDYHKRLKKAMTKVAKGELTHKEALELSKKPKKVAVHVPNTQNSPVKNKDTRKRKLNKSGGK